MHLAGVGIKTTTTEKFKKGARHDDDKDVAHEVGILLAGVGIKNALAEVGIRNTYQ
jgi:hypothetical protein